jgi:hypothetical protein
MEIQPSLVPGGQSSELAEPGKRALALTSFIPTCACPAAHCSPLLAWLSGVWYLTSSMLAAPLEVVPLIRMKFGRTIPSSTSSHLFPRLFPRNWEATL